MARLIAVFEEGVPGERLRRGATLEKTPSQHKPAQSGQQKIKADEASTSGQSKPFDALAFWEGLCDPHSPHFEEFWKVNQTAFVHFQTQKTEELGDLGLKLNCISYIAHMQSRYQHDLSKQKARMLWGDFESSEEGKKHSLKEISELTREDISALAKEAVLMLYPLPESNNQRY